MSDEIAIFGIGGGSDTGKTEMICELVEELSKRGYKPATIKHTQGDFSIDEEGKDTWRHSEAGAKLVVFSTPAETDFLVQRPMSMEETLMKIGALDRYDVVLVEGMKNEDIPKIVLDEEKSEDGKLLRESLERIEEEMILKELPGIDCRRCGFESCEEMAGAIVKGEKAIDDCEVMGTEKREGVELSVNGEKLPLTKFPSKLLKNTIKGMVTSLKGVEDEEEIDEIEIKISE
ncbi:MAG: molybdopterin-guanine dinucleotide biosynthesis protein B [Candidatus Aenigmatarchaeota archaeon]